MQKSVLAVLIGMVLMGSASACSSLPTAATTDVPVATSHIAVDGQPSEEQVSQEISKPPAERIAINEMSLTLHPGERCSLRVMVQPEGADTEGLVWHSSDDSVVSVTPQGKLKALSHGEVTITVTTPGNVTASCRVSVYGEYVEDPEEDDDSTPENTEDGAGASWFDDAIFIGDSVMYGLYNYAENGCLGEADFLAIDCMGYHTAMLGLDDEYGIHPVYNGVKVMIDDAVQAIGKQQVFIMLGMNDIASWGVEESVDAMQAFVDQLLAKNPDIQLYIHSVTPMIAEKDGTREDYLNNADIARYDEQIKQICADRGFVYLDLYPVVSDGNGNLRDDYCVDPGNLGFHYNSAGMQAWVDFLKTHVS